MAGSPSPLPVPVTVPVTVLGGYLGAGKTTLVNYLLRHAGGRRVLVLVNDFGELSIDADLIAAREGDLLTLANGCACCQVGEDLLGALTRAVTGPSPPDHLLIEASGIADPVRLANIARADPALRLDGVLVLADAQAVRRQAADRWSGETVLGQLGSAGLIVLNKLDLVTPEERAGLDAWLAQAAPRAVVVPAVHARVDPELAFGPAGWGEGHAHPAAHDHADPFAHWSGTSEAGIPAERTRAMLKALPAWVYRAKGRSVDPLTGDAFAFHRTASEVRIEPLDRAPPGTAMVVIGPRESFDADLLRAALADLTAPVG